MGLFLISYNYLNYIHIFVFRHFSLADYPDFPFTVSAKTIDAYTVSKILDGFGKLGSPFVIRYIVRRTKAGYFFKVRATNQRGDQNQCKDQTFHSPFLNQCKVRLFIVLSIAFIFREAASAVGMPVTWRPPGKLLNKDTIGLKLPLMGEAFL